MWLIIIIILDGFLHDDTTIQYLAIKLLDRISCVIVYNLPRHQQNCIQNMKDNNIPFMSESCLVMGDFNIQNTETRLQDVMTEHHFIQLINSATHYRPYLHHRFTHCSKRSTSCLSVIYTLFKEEYFLFIGNLHIVQRGVLPVYR